jgi:hypothetical protein
VSPQLGELRVEPFADQLFVLRHTSPARGGERPVAVESEAHETTLGARGRARDVHPGPRPGPGNPLPELVLRGVEVFVDLSPAHVADAVRAVLLPYPGCSWIWPHGRPPSSTVTRGCPASFLPRDPRNEAM